jgi:hypothetical protein
MAEDTIAPARQAASCALLVRPACFGYNQETAATNRFQRSEEAPVSGAVMHSAAQRARSELERLAQGLSERGVRVCLIEDSAEPAKPDAVFPNNWVSWHADGTVVLYPLLAPSRRPERRAELLASLEGRAGFARRRLLDLSPQERQGHYLEGTGSLVIDRRHRVAYACRSPRTDERLARQWARLLAHELVLFDATAEGTPVYHTNVMLAIGSEWALICTAVIHAPDRARVLGRLAASGRTLIEVSAASLQEFAANILELAAPGPPDREPRRVLALSARAHVALKREGVWPQLRACVDDALVVDVPTIERLGGGSVRCMIAEIPAAQTLEAHA